MVVLPVFLILTLTTWYYYDSHIAEVNRKLGQSIARDVSVVQDFCVITSYSIHYTKLYEIAPCPRPAAEKTSAPCPPWTIRVLPPGSQGEPGSR